MLVTQDTGHERGQVGAGFCSTRLPGCGSDTGRSGEGRNSLGGAGETGLRGGWVGWKENMEGRTEVRAGVGKGEALRGQGRARKPWGGFGKGAIATQGEREGEGGKETDLKMESHVQTVYLGVLSGLCLEGRKKAQLGRRRGLLVMQWQQKPQPIP